MASEPAFFRLLKTTILLQDHDDKKIVILYTAVDH